MCVSEDRCCPRCTDSQGCLENQVMPSDWWDFPGLGVSLESLSCCFPASLTPRPGGVGGGRCRGTVLDLQPQDVGPFLFPSHPSRPADSSLAGLPHLPVPSDSALARPSQTHQFITEACWPQQLSRALPPPVTPMPQRSPGLLFVLCLCLCLNFDTCFPFVLTPCPPLTSRASFKINF